LHLLEALAAHVAYDEEEARALEQIRAFVAEERRCFDRTLPAGHVTGSAWVLDHGRRYVLLTHHRKLDLWLQLGGHAENEDDVAAVASREALEESGLARIELVSEAIFDVDVHAIPARGDEPFHLHYDVRLCFLGDRRARLRASSESREIAWFALGAVAGLKTDASVLRMVRKSADRRFG